MSRSDLIALVCAPYTLTCNPSLGGSLANFRYDGRDLLRPQSGKLVLDSACFPLVPFCNRIAGGTFAYRGMQVTLAPNHPRAPNEPVLHGFGWLTTWRVETRARNEVTLACAHCADQWPWRFEARQTFTLDREGLKMALSVTNLSDSPMPVGLGFHPFFPRCARSVLRARHRGEQRLDGSLDLRTDARDWWGGKPVGSRIVDTTYVDREGDMSIELPDRGMGLTLASSPELAHTHVYVPPEADYFCVEPVSHRPDAFTSRDAPNDLRLLDEGEQWSVWMRLSAYALPSG